MPGVSLGSKVSGEMQAPWGCFLQNPPQMLARTQPRLRALCCPDLIGELRLPPAPTPQEAGLGRGSRFLAQAVSKVCGPKRDVMLLQVTGAPCWRGCPRCAQERAAQSPSAPPWRLHRGTQARMVLVTDCRLCERPSPDVDDELSCSILQKAL